MKKVLILSLFTLLVGVSHIAAAKCYKKFSGTPSGDASGGVPLVFGTIRLLPDEFQPVGLIGSTHASPSQVTAPQIAGGNPLMFQCDLDDEASTYELFATNGDSNVGGFNQVDANINGGNVYQTFLPRIGLKLIHDRSGLPFTRFWQQARIVGHRENGHLNFYLNDFSPVTAEIYKLSHTDRTSASASWGCNGPADDNYTGTVTCPQPNAYVAFVGPGWNDNRNTKPGADSNTNWGGFTGGTNWIGYGLNYSSANNLYQTPFGCRVFNYVPEVYLPPITLAQIEAGVSVGASFNVAFKCDGSFLDFNHNLINYTADRYFDKAINGTNSSDSGNISIAFMATHRHDDVYKNYGNLVPYLLSDNYGQPGYAGGVGIGILTTQDKTPILFIRENIASSSRGWYPMATGMERVETTGTQRMVYSSFYAYYAALGRSVPITAGKIDATAYIMVRYQ